MQTGITITALVAGVVPEYDQREAARFALYTWSQYSALPRSEQARTVAHYMVHNKIEAVTNDAIDQHLTRVHR